MNARRSLRFVGIASAVLMPAGPMTVAVIRLVIPYGPPLEAAGRNQGLAGFVLALGIVATLTLVPGTYAALGVTHLYRPVTTVWVGVLLVPAYLALAALSLADAVVLVGVQRQLDPATVTGISEGVGELGTTLLLFGLFLIGHIAGTVLLGILCFQARLMPRAIAVLLAISQPLHLTAVIVESHWLDFAAWSLTALGMAFLAAHAIRSSRPVNADETSQN